MQATSLIRWFPAFSIIGMLGLGMGIPGAIATPQHPHSTPEHSSRLLEPTSQQPVRSDVLESLLMAQATMDVVDAAIAQGSFRTFIQLLSQLGMEEDLRGFGRFTVFAPTDAAFDALPEEVMEVLAGDRNLLARVLSNHVISSGTPYTSDTVTSTVSVRTLQGNEVEIRRRGNSLSVDGHRVIIPDITAENGVIHGIDTLLISDDLMLEIQQQL